METDFFYIPTLKIGRNAIFHFVISICGKAQTYQVQIKSVMLERHLFF